MAGKQVYRGSTNQESYVDTDTEDPTKILSYSHIWEILAYSITQEKSWELYKQFSFIDTLVSSSVEYDHKSYQQTTSTQTIILLNMKLITILLAVVLFASLTAAGK